MAALRALARREIPRTLNKRTYHDYVRFQNKVGSGRVLLNSPGIVGHASSRGERIYQEDYYSFVGLSLDPEELRLSAKTALNVDWDPTSAGSSSRQVMFAGLYDGHGGSAVSQFLRQEFHGLFEHVDKSTIPETCEWVRELGGYFRRFDGGVLKPWLSANATSVGSVMDLTARATLAFFTADRQLGVEVAHKCGATASVVLLHALDCPQPAFFASQKLAITVAHAGDTRVLLCSATTGRPHAMTDNHHPESRPEATRLRRSPGSALVTDSFGETRFMGALANTRCLGDLRFKPYGVTAEPEVRSKLLENGEWACVILASDGVTSLVSDGEMCGIARYARTPQDAASAILSYAEEMGSEDNGTVLVLPLAGWGQVQGPDSTAELRKYRSTQMIGSERQRRM